jgi:hypothetical protein
MFEILRNSSPVKQLKERLPMMPLPLSQLIERNGIYSGLNALIEVVNRIDKSVKNAEKACGNKLCTENYNAEEWIRKRIGDSLLLYCRPCSEAITLKQYCDYCKQIYRDTAHKNAIVDGEDWILCEECKRWTHIQCEAKNGREDIELLILDPKFTYSCKDCSSKASLKGKSKGKRTCKR